MPKLEPTDSSNRLMRVKHQVKPRIMRQLIQDGRLLQVLYNR